MKVKSWGCVLRNAIGRGIFPHQLSFILELPFRKLLLSPRTLAARLPLTGTSVVLEVGAGSGFYSIEVARRISGGRLDLLDVQPEMLKKTQRKLEANGFFNAGYVLADARQLPFADCSFDLVFIVTVLGEIADQGAFLREANRVLKPDGILFRKRALS